MSLPMTTGQAAKTGTGISVIFGGLFTVVPLILEAVKDGQLTPTEVGAIGTAICTVFGIIRLRRAVGFK